MHSVETTPTPTPPIPWTCNRCFQPMLAATKGATAMRSLASWSLALALLLIVRPAFGLDGVRVTGTAAKLQMELNDNTVDEALTELRSAFGLKCRCSISLDR